MKVFISPPFGNWISYPGTYSVIGSYTLEERPGLIWRVFSTLRYSWKYKGWINKIGLRNKGIEHGIAKYGRGKILSIAILQPSDIDEMLKRIPSRYNLELNVSCPNVKEKLVNSKIEKFIGNREWCIVKVSPLVEIEEISNYYNLGFRQFHISNTLPVKNGGLSGSVLVEKNLKTIRKVKKEYKDVVIIGGGGIKSFDVMQRYLQAGADHISVSTLFFHPIKLLKFYSSFTK